MGDSELLELDGRVQSLIRRQFKALVHLCMSSANVLKVLAPVMQKETRSYLRSRLGDFSVSDIYLRQFGENGDQAAADQLAEAFELASPEVIASAPVREMNCLAVPAGGSEDHLRQLARSVADGKPLVSASSSDEIVLYREHTLGCLADLKQLGPLGQQAYRKMTDQEHFTPHSRNDIVTVSKQWGVRSDER